jgi:hypothetical protein
MRDYSESNISRPILYIGAVLVILSFVAGAYFMADTSTLQPGPDATFNYSYTEQNNIITIEQTSGDQLNPENLQVLVDETTVDFYSLSIQNGLITIQIQAEITTETPIKITYTSDGSQFTLDSKTITSV